MVPTVGVTGRSSEWLQPTAASTAPRAQRKNNLPITWDSVYRGARESDRSEHPGGGTQPGRADIARYSRADVCDARRWLDVVCDFGPKDLRRERACAAGPCPPLGRRAHALLRQCIHATARGAGAR